jgi:hypothetical protein
MGRAYEAGLQEVGDGLYAYLQARPGLGVEQRGAWYAAATDATRRCGSLPWTLPSPPATVQHRRHSHTR